VRRRQLNKRPLNKKIKLSSLIVSTIASSFLLFSLFGYAAEDNEATKQQLEQIKQQIKQVQSRLDRTRKKYGSAAQALRKTEKQINSAAKILRGTQRQIKRQRSTLKSNQQRERQLEQTKQHHQQLLATQLQSAYTSGRQEYLKLMLNQQDPAKLGRVITYYDYLNKARTKSIKQLGNTIIELQQVQESIENSLKELVVLEKAQTKEQQRLQGLKAERKKAVDRLAKSIASEDKKLANLRDNEIELQSILKQMQAALAEMVQQQNLSGLSKVRGKLSWPIKGRLLQKYGQRINRDIRSNGIRISASEGKEIAAVFHGRVIFSDWLRGFGLLMIVDHGEGYMSLYGNNQSLYKDVGDWVEAGELIATVGQSGGQRAPGLYFEIRHQGKASDPMRWIRNS
jgi:septal ring factor EnvC (AmiA/AmiB activator)